MSNCLGSTLSCARGIRFAEVSFPPCDITFCPTNHTTTTNGSTLSLSVKQASYSMGKSIQKEDQEEEPTDLFDTEALSVGKK